MKKLSLIITVAIAIAAASAAAYKFDVAGLLGSNTKEKGDKKATAPLVFRPSEIVKPTQIALGSKIEWAGSSHSFRALIQGM